MSARRLALAILVAAATVARTREANAQETSPMAGAPFGARAQNVIVVDELAGIYRETFYSPDQSNSDESGFLRIGSHAGGLALNETTRFGYHRFVTPEISVGTGLHYSSRDVAEGGLVKQTTLGLSPRVGFVVAAGGSGAFWLRFGVQYYHYDLPDDESAWDFGPGVELFYVITPFEHFGITIGPTIELQLAGNIHTPGSGTTPGHDEAIRRRTFGFALGFLFDL